ncbi:hypothetical protein QYE76_044146 [Lolium multiflorum]|uniref:Retrotransposon gag domain-containing protein n=1 Tax=Lolium multiflorum TaxID=4521 RepID=A0AAD8WYU7_LOLMU|nr:hypothetical protein QYE76_044146 [Lolium multiflorum]
MVKKKNSSAAASSTSGGAAAKSSSSLPKGSASNAPPPAPAPPAPPSSITKPGDWIASTITKRDEKRSRSLGLISSDEGNVVLPAAEVIRASPVKRSTGGFADEDDLFDIDEGFIEPPSKKAKSGAAPPVVTASKASAPKAAPAAQASTASSLSKGKDAPAATTTPPSDLRGVISSLEAFASQFTSLEADKVRLQREVESSSSKLDGAVKIAAEARQEIDSLTEELGKLKEKLKEEEASRLAAEAQAFEKDELLQAANIPVSALDKMIFPKIKQDKTLGQLIDAFAVDTKEVIEVFPVPSFVDDSSGALPEGDRIQRMKDRITQMEKDLRSTYALAAIVNKKSEIAAEVERYALTELHKATESLSCIATDEVRKKLFSISLSGKAAHWYKLLKNGDSLDWEDIVPLFYSKFYPPSEIHRDRNRIYNFWPHDGESIAQAWGRLKSLMLKCPIHELPGNIIIDNFYARLSFQDKTLLDTSCSGSFTRNKEEFKRDLLNRIQENTEGWENDKDRESGINYDYKCIEAFMDTDKFRNMSATYGLDSQVVANLYKAFASHYELPKKNFDKYHEPYKDKIDSSINKCVVIETVDHVIPEAYIEKTPFPAKMKEYSVISSAVNKSAKKPIEPEEQIKVEPAIGIVKDLVTENVEDGHIIFCEDASNIVSHPNKSRKASVPMLSVRIGDHCYYGLCDIGASISAIPYELYTEIMHEIGSCELEDIDVVIRLANRETISPIGIVRDVEFLCGKIKYPADFVVLGSAASKYCPIIFGRPFLNTCGAVIDCKKEKIVTKFAGESYEFNFSKFAKTPYKADLPNNDFRVEQCASIALAPNNPLQQHLENSESEVFREERNELDEIFLHQPILKHDLPVEDLGTTPPPKEDPVLI